MPRRGAAFPCCVSASRGLSRALDEPVNPRKREGESSPVNAEVMTGVATLKDPRRSAIAGTASRLSSRSLSLFFSLFLYLSISFCFLALRQLALPSPLSLTAGFGRHACSIQDCQSRSAGGARQREKLKSPTPPQKDDLHLHRDFRESLFSQACDTGRRRGLRRAITPISLPGPSRPTKITGINGHPVFNHRNRSKIA